MTIKFNFTNEQNFDYLLIGNTRLHWALRNNKSYKFCHTLLDQSFPKKINLKKVIWASVGKYPTNKFSKENEITLDTLGYNKMPQHIGIDRALACFAAHKIIENKYKKNILIVDLGTTVSITKTSNKGELIGGQLFPGFTTQLKSMEQNTKNLKFPDNVFIPNNNFEISTDKAMLRGVYNSIIGAINLSFDPTEDLLIFCGGDSNLIKKSIKQDISNCIIEPDLVMYGMIFLRK
tara:strand:+ start:107 stop:808 length:702 start_codon:yes stop_codon:yes gene_type:complete